MYNVRTKKIDPDFRDFKTDFHHDLLLPARVSDEILAKLEEAEMARQRAAEAAEAAAEEKESKLDPWLAESAERRAREAEKEKAAAALASAPLPAWCSVQTRLIKRAFAHTVFTASALQAAADASHLRTKDEKDRKRNAALFDLWKRIGGRRRIAAPVKRWRIELDAIAEEMPNFSQVINYLRGELALAERSKQPARLAPMLLDGPPCVGKTTFARKLSALFGTGFLSVSMETSQTSSALSGSEEYWGNSKAGLLFSMLVEGEHANPIVLVDEIDKCRGGDRDPAAALYGLLEPSSAATWHDLAVPTLKLDASRVIWVLTSNNKHLVATPLLSRMKVFDIPGLTPEQSRDAARRIFAGVVRDLNMRKFNLDLPMAMATKLAVLSPRAMHRVSRELVATAVVADRNHVIQQDLVGMDLEPAQAGTVRMTVEVKVSSEPVDEAAGATLH